MKKLVFLLSPVLMMLLYTCSVDDSLTPELTGDEALKSAHGVVITVSPSPDGDDTDEIMAAFEDAKAAGPGAMVRLTGGTFTIGFLEIRDFNGVFKGSGKTATTVTNQEELPCGDAFENNVIPSLVKFIGGNVEIADMTFRIKDGRPCAFSELNDLYVGDLFSILILADYNDTYVPDVRNIRAVVDNVDFVGGVDDGYGLWGTTHNTCIGVWCGPDFWWPLWNEPFGNGSYNLTNCRFKFFLDGAEGFGLGHYAVMKIQNSIFEQGLMQLYFTACSGGKIIIANNRFTDGILTDILLEDAWMDLVFPAVMPDYRTEFLITGNVFDSPEGLVSLHLHDVMRVQTGNDDFSMLYNVHKNVFKTRDNGTAILSEYNKDARIWNNIFQGEGDYGIQVQGGDEAWASGIMILNNNFSKADYTTASVFLGPNSTKCKVVGIASDKVVDMGVDNTIIGTQGRKQGPPFMVKKYPSSGMTHPRFYLRTP